MRIDKLKDTLNSNWFGWVLIAILLFTCACLVVFSSGCAGAQFAVSLEADRKLVAGARSNAEVVLAGARAAGDKPTTVQLLEGVVASLGTIQAGPIGTAAATVWPPAIADAVIREMRCEPQIVVNDRIVQDPEVIAALEQERKLRLAYEADSRKVHGALQEAQGALKEAGGRWTGGAVAGAVAGTGGPLALILGLLWRNRQRISAALVHTVAIGQEFKSAAEAAGAEIDPAEIAARHARGYEHEIAVAYERATGKIAKVKPKPTRVRKVVERVRRAIRRRPLR